jgi:light-regulated signal transduction histidine kinase (bacteriophytochrome)
MQALIGGLLEYSRAGVDESSRRPFELETSRDLALVNLRGSLAESGAVVEREALPVVVGDSVQLAQVLQNLIANALKFRRPEAAVLIRISAEQRGNEGVVSVADNGIGVDPQYAERIFMIFQRLHTRAEYPGTGIGLSICKKVIERNGGRIWVEPTQGGGSTFRFTVPLAPSGGR